MKRNTKVTITLKQLKRILKESRSNHRPSVYGQRALSDINMVCLDLAKAKAETDDPFYDKMIAKLSQVREALKQHDWIDWED